jgi:hypothetical protein
MVIGKGQTRPGGLGIRLDAAPDDGGRDGLAGGLTGAAGSRR